MCSICLLQLCSPITVSVTSQLPQAFVVVRSPPFSYAVTLFAEDKRWIKSGNQHLKQGLSHTQKKAVFRLDHVLGDGKVDSVVDSRKSSQFLFVTSLSLERL